MEENGLKNYGELIPDQERCQRCKGARIDYSASQHSILCTDCREAMIRYPFPKRFIPFLIVILILFVIAMVKTPGKLGEYRQYVRAEQAAKDGDIRIALEQLQDLLVIYPDSVKIAERTVMIAMKHGQYDIAAFVLYEHLAGKEVDSRVYAELTGYSNQLDRFYATYERLDEFYKQADRVRLEQEDFSEVTDFLKELLRESEVDRGMIYYNLAMITRNSVSAEKYLKSCVEADGRVSYYYAGYATNLRRNGKLDDALENYERALSIDRMDTGALRGLGILMMLKDEHEKGLAYIKQAFEENPDENYVKETYIIALLENGMPEEAARLKKEFEAAGEIFDESFRNFIDGGVSLYDYYVTPEV